MMTLAQAVAALLADPRPILFLDTCTLLDIIRATKSGLAATVRAAVELRALAVAGDVRLFVQDIVPGEWAGNLSSARRGGEEGVQSFSATWRIAVDLGQPAPPPPVSPPGNLVDVLEQLSRDLMMSAEVLDRDFDGMSWAMDRVASQRKPSSKKGTVKDCHILGHALRLCILLGLGYARSRMLVSSNREDFAGPNANAFHKDIATEATAAGLRYANSLEAAIADLRAAGEI